MYFFKPVFFLALIKQNFGLYGPVLAPLSQSNVYKVTCWTVLEILEMKNLRYRNIYFIINHLMIEFYSVKVQWVNLGCKIQTFISALSVVKDILIMDAASNPQLQCKHLKPFKSWMQPLVYKLKIQRLCLLPFAKFKGKVAVRTSSFVKIPFWLEIDFVFANVGFRVWGCIFLDRWVEVDPVWHICDYISNQYLAAVH